MKKEYLNPKDLSKPGSYTHAVGVAGAAKLVYVSGQVSYANDGSIVGKGDMRAQLRKVCENIGKGLAYAGANFDDVVRATTYVTDIEEYYKCSDERFKFFKNVRPASTLIQISRLGHRDCMVEIECEAIIEPERLKSQ